MLTATGASDPLIPPALLVLAGRWPIFSDPVAEAEIGWVVDLVTAIRSVRAEMNIPPATLTPLVLSGASDETKAARSAGTTWSSGWRGWRRFPLPANRRRARCNYWCAARSRRCR